MTNLQKTLRRLKSEIAAVDGLDEYTIFGSSALILRKIVDREPGDLDVMTTKRVWGNLLPRKGWEVETPKAGDPPMLARHDWPVLVNVFFDWSSPAAEIDPDYLLATSEEVNGVRLASVDEVLRHKEEAAAYGTKVRKHKADIRKIEEHMAVVV